MARSCILITAFGSLGDLHPYLAVGQELARRGIAVRLATQELFRERVEAAGLTYCPLRAATITEPSPEVMRQVFAGRTGVRYLLRDVLAPMIRQAYEDTLAAAAGADLLVAHPITLATPLVAERLRLPWVATQLAPSALPSAYDPPVFPGMEWMQRVTLPRALYRGVFRLADWQIQRWLQPVVAFRAELGLVDRGNPFFAGAYADKMLALFSPLLGAPQPDWPSNVAVTGFPFFAQDTVPNPVLESWLVAGPPPIVFTLGSSAVMHPGTFFATSIAAARQLGQRALLVGYAPEGEMAEAFGRERASNGAIVDGDPAIFAVPYAAYSQVFQRAAVTVHQGGIGTTAEALRAGRPMLVVPFGVDQPDNAARVARLGTGLALDRRAYRPEEVVRTLKLLLGAEFTSRSAAVGAAIRAEDGSAAAADVLETLLRALPR